MSATLDSRFFTDSTASILTTKKTRYYRVSCDPVEIQKQESLNLICSHTREITNDDIDLFIQLGGRMVSSKRARKLRKRGEYVRWSPYFGFHCWIREWIPNMNGWN